MKQAQEVLTFQVRSQGAPDVTPDAGGDGSLDRILRDIHDIVDAARLLARVPLTVRGEALGSLLPAEEDRDPASTAEDRELVRMLAAAAGVAIENAELFDEAQRRQAWQSATTEIITLLLAGEEPPAVLSVLLGQVMRLGGAAAAVVVVPTEEPARLRVAAGAGLLNLRPVGECICTKGSISHLVRSGRAAIVVEDLAADPRTLALADQAPGIGPVVAAPLGVAAAEGVLLVARARDEPPFQPPDVEMIASFAAHTGRALTLADARRKRELVLLVRDRERIAQHLSEQAMQTLLGISTTVHGLIARMRTPDDAHRLGEQVDRLDEVLQEMRRAIFGLQLPVDERAARSEC
jgi:two-component system, NarL family, sensor histidine kinase DevS